MTRRVIAPDSHTDVLWPAQRERLERFDVAASADIHCHCLPGLDDGPADIAAAVELCRSLARDGTTVVVATPHQLGKYDLSNTGAEVRRRVERLKSELSRESIPLTILPGADVRVDERLVELIEDGSVLTLAGGPWLLLELPHDVWIDPTGLIGSLGERGIRTVVSHPERHGAVQGNPSRVRPWVEAGAALQITAGSLCGDFGAAAAQAAWSLVHGGAASIVASDAHDPHRRPPRMTEAIDRLVRAVGRDAARALCLDNPSRIVTGESLIPCSE